MPEADLYIKKYNSLPGFDYKKTGDCKIFGNSRPDGIEGIDSIYTKGLEYLKGLISENITINFTFDFDYFNTFTQRYIYDILFLLDKYENVKKVTWIYIDIDEDMEDMGEQYKLMFRSLKIKLKSKK